MTSAIDRITFDPRTGRYRGARGHFLRQAQVPLAFTCRFCQRLRPLQEMRMLTRFFPPLAACTECERRIG